MREEEEEEEEEKARLKKQRQRRQQIEDEENYDVNRTKVRGFPDASQALSIDGSLSAAMELWPLEYWAAHYQTQDDVDAMSDGGGGGGSGGGSGGSVGKKPPLAAVVAHLLRRLCPALATPPPHPLFPPLAPPPPRGPCRSRRRRRRLSYRQQTLVVFPSNNNDNGYSPMVNKPENLPLSEADDDDDHRCEERDGDGVHQTTFFNSNAPSSFQFSAMECAYPRRSGRHLGAVAVVVSAGGGCAPFAPLVRSARAA